MNDDEWNRLRNRATLEAFRTGRSVFADSDGQLRCGDSDSDDVEDAAVDLPQVVLPKPSWWLRVRQWWGGA